MTSSVPTVSAPAAQSGEPGLSTTELTNRYLLGNYGRFDLVPARAEGCRLWDEDGREFLDFSGGVAVTSLGHCPPAMREALAAQAARLIHCSNLFHIREQGLLGRFLTDEVMQRPGRNFFCNSGAEANEALIKLARRYGSLTPHPDGRPRQRILTFINSFHGRTLGAMSATAQTKIRDGFGDLLPGFDYLPLNDPEALRAAVDDDTVAILIEPVQGEGGVHVASPEFLAACADLRRRHRLLLLFDEVQCGLGRVGQWCGWRALEGGGSIEPDAVSWAKGIAGGFPLGAVWIGDHEVPTSQGQVPLASILGPGSHGSTYGGSPLACAVALAVLEAVRDQGLPQRAAGLGARIRDRLLEQPVPGIRGLRGLGLMLGLELDEARLRTVPGWDDPSVPLSGLVVKRLMAAGLLTVPAGPLVVRFLPPLNVTDDDVEQAMSTLDRVMREVLPGDAGEHPGDA